MNLKATGYYILIELEEIEEKSDGGILLPKATLEKEQGGHHIGIIRSFGPLCFTGYKGIPDNLLVEERAELYGVKIGDRVECGRYAGSELWHPEYKNYRMIQDEYIRGVYEG